MSRSPSPPVGGLERPLYRLPPLWGGDKCTLMERTGLGNHINEDLPRIRSSDDYGPGSLFRISLSSCI